jgi:hypothetical protein
VIQDSLFSTREWTAAGVGDYDADGLPDIAFADISPKLEEGMRVVVLRNEGGMRFAPNLHLIPGFYGGSIDFADADGDGDLDLLCSGMAESPVTAVFSYDAGQFRQTWTAQAPVGHGEARWADFNSDGFPDLLICGRGATASQSAAYLQSNGSLVLLQGPAGMPALYHARLAWADWNSDGYPDFAIIGQGDDDRPAGIIGTWNNIFGKFEF